MVGSLAVLERRWEKRGNYSVRQLFELVSAVDDYDPHAFRYDMFSEAISFRTVVSKIAALKRYEALYLGSHGDRCGLKEDGKQRQNRVELSDLIDVLRDGNKERNLWGVYFGVCSFGHELNLKDLLDPASGTQLKWVAGYSKDVGWLESAAADMLFWGAYLHSPAEPLARATQGAKIIRKMMPNADENLGFGAYKWSRERGGLQRLL